MLRDLQGMRRSSSRSGHWAGDAVVGSTPEGTTNSGPTSGGTTNSGATSGGTTNSGPTSGGTTNSGPTSGGTTNGVAVSAMFVPVPWAVPLSRRFVRRHVDDPGLADVAALLVSELATNAVEHAGTPFEVVVATSSGRVRVEVADGGSLGAHVSSDPRRRGAGPSTAPGAGIRPCSTWPSPLSGPRCAGHGSEREHTDPGRPASGRFITPACRPRPVDSDRGRGLDIVGRLATRWGVDRRSVNGTIVWFELEAPQRASAHEA